MFNFLGLLPLTVTKKKKKKKSGILSYRVAPKGSIDVPVENLPESHYILRAIQSPHFEKKCRYSYQSTLAVKNYDSCLRKSLALRQIILLPSKQDLVDSLMSTINQIFYLHLCFIFITAQRISIIISILIWKKLRLTEEKKTNRR